MDFGLKDVSVWRNGDDISASDLLDQAVDIGAARRALDRFGMNEHVEPLGGGFLIRASLIWLYLREYRRGDGGIR